MLALNRRDGSRVEMVVPPSDSPTRVVVHVDSASGGWSRLAFECPRSVVILRGELIDRLESIGVALGVEDPR